MTPLRILIGDDHTLVRHALKRVLEDQPDWQVVAEAGDGRQAVRLTLQEHPDVAILDVAMPTMNGVDAASAIAQQVPDTAVLMLSMHGDDVWIRRALQAGARGYLLKDSESMDLIGAVEAVASGRSYFSPAVSSIIVGDYMRRVSQRSECEGYDRLSEREREVFQLVAEGRTNRQIAEALNIRPTTVETHRARILQKLDLHSTTELVLWAVRHRVVA
jgi:DNA-binding NarL/FixJ family response regulator